MKIVFLGFAITPYFRDFLNRLNSVEGIEITNIRPTGQHKHVGEGVHQDCSRIDFEDKRLDEVSFPQRCLFNLDDFIISPSYSTFTGLVDYLDQSRPDVIVVQSVFQQTFHYQKTLHRVVSRIGAKIVFHSIPFELPKYDELIESISVPARLQLKRFPMAGKLIRGLGLDLVYLRLIRKRALLFPVREKAKIFRSCDAHAVYHDDAYDIYGSYGVPEERIHVVRNSPNTEDLLDSASRYPNRLEGYRLIHVGRLVGWKRVDLLIRMIAQLRNGEFPDADLLVIGYGPSEDEWKALAKELGVLEAVQFVGGVYDPDELAHYYSTSSIYVLAGMGGVSINEAMCFGMPIVCSRCDGTEKFLVREGINGLFFREESLQDLIQKTSLILRDKGLRNSMGVNSLNIIKNELNTEIHVNNYINLFQSITGEDSSKYVRKRHHV